MEEERYVDISGYEGIYQVSNHGNVRSLTRIDARGWLRQGKLKSLSINQSGYYIVCLNKNGKANVVLVNRLVAIAFVPNNTSSNTVVNHINRVKTDNYYKNLEWTNFRENKTYERIGAIKSSKYTGVTYDKSVKKKQWKSTIYINGTNKHLSHFKTEDEAGAAYVQALSDNNLINKYAQV